MRCARIVLVTSAVVFATLLAACGNMAGSFEYARGEIVDTRYGAGTARQRPTVWVYSERGLRFEQSHAWFAILRRVAQVCGLQPVEAPSASARYEASPPPPHVFRLKITEVTEVSRPAYQTIRIGLSLIRGRDNNLLASAEEVAYYRLPDRPVNPQIRPPGNARFHDIDRDAWDEVAQRALQRVCQGNIQSFSDQPQYNVYQGWQGLPEGNSECGYGAAGKYLKSGQSDLRYGCTTY